MRWVLDLTESILQIVNRFRRALYRAGILRRRRLPRPVVSIGNIAAGGAGKTPAVIAVADFLTARGARVAVLTRGYGRRGAEEGLLSELDPERFGDEPTLIKMRNDKVDVIVGRHRYKNAYRYLSDNETDIFILDDGFQHLQLYRDMDIVIDARSRFHREGRSALAAADVVIPRRLHISVPPSVMGRRVFAFSALADNEQFFSTLRTHGLDLVGARGFRDHHRYSARDMEAIIEAARRAGAEVIVTTEKDAVKIQHRDIIPIRANFVIEPEVLERVAALTRK